jgi:hypothetical protein
MQRVDETDSVAAYQKQYLCLEIAFLHLEVNGARHHLV